jgi:hypothetical protein
VCFPYLRDFLPRLQNHIHEFTTSPGTCRRPTSMSPSQDRQPTPTFLGNAQFLQTFPSSLRLQKTSIPGTSVELYCDTSSTKPRPYVPSTTYIRHATFPQPSRHQIDGQARLPTLRVASHPKRLPHLGPSLPTLPALQNLTPHHHSSRHFPPPSCPLLTRPHRPNRSSTILSRISILLDGGRSFHALARSLPHPRHHSRNSVTCPALWMDFTLWLSADHHDGPRTPVRVPIFPQPRKDVWGTTAQNDSLPSRSQRTCRTTTPHT